MAKRSYTMDMCSGPLPGKIIRFAFPLMLSGILQRLFNAADIVVVGRFSGSEALAAVGSTGSLINLLVNVFIGLSIGTNVLAARYIGAQDAKNLSETVHTSILLSLVSGTILIFVGFFFAKPLLTLMGSPAEVLDQAALYMKIYFAGMPVNMLYNFGSAVLRALGDTKRPLYFLMIAGVVNVCLNLIFVIVFHMGVAGVAIATVASQLVSAVLVTICLIRADGPYRLDPKRLHIHKDKLIAMIKIGLPAGLQGAIFSISNVLIQSSINSFGAIAMAGNTAAGNIEGFIYTSMNALYQANLSFTSQNLGARKYSRLNRISVICCLMVTVVGLTMGKHHPFPEISPKKSTEGCVGSLVFGVAASVVYGMVISAVSGMEVSYVNMALIGLAVNPFVQFGDLVFSAIKREMGIKDFSRLLGDHGGMQDRFDSALFAAPVVWAMVNLIGVFK